MKKTLLSLSAVVFGTASIAQGPAITSWMINTTGITGQHYVSGNSTPIAETVLANVETVQYSSNWVYITTSGVPAYVTGPFLDGNPSLASDQNAIFKFPLNPSENTGTPTATTMGNIGVFINGVALFDYRDGVSWKNSTSSLAGGPLGGTGDNIWNRDAVVAEMSGFDCSKGHPAMGNYHHHQNPSAYDLDLAVLSNICTLYDADGLYMLDSTVHSPLIGYAYDGFPIYGAYGYANADGTGGITRIKSSYELRNITVRTIYADGTDVTDGPAVSSTYPLGYFREDYEYVAGPTADYLDEHNGRFCVTPEYPGGTYAYFCTVDAEWNSAYPYAVGPTFYGNKTAAKVTSISEAVTTYDPSAAGIVSTDLQNANIELYPNPSNEFVAIQIGSLNNENISLDLYNLQGKLIQSTTLYQGTTIAYFDVRTLYSGEYVVRISNSGGSITKKILVTK
ncbi:MAG: YHYH protein [Bacteroidetes bacterium]|nr:YHYH protein [Bacteroidota bacterium]